MTTTSLKHIVSNVENIRNPVITHCYYGNLLLLSGLCFPSVFVSLCFMCFCFCSFICNRCLFLVFATHISFSVLVHLLILVALRFAYRRFRSSSLTVSYLLGKHISRDTINGMRMLFAPGVLSLFFLYPYFYWYHLAGMLYWIWMTRRRYPGCWLHFGTSHLVFCHINII